METAERKRRDMRRREELFLDRARSVLLKHGYHGLTMDRIAKATGYSRGTIYQHFGCKEDIIVALVTRGMERRLAMMERCGAFRGRSRERMQVIGEAVELFTRLFPDDARILLLGNGEVIVQKASEKSLRGMRTCLERSMAVAAGIVRDAIAQGDLVLTRATPEEVVFHLWAIAEGGYAVASSLTPPFEAWIPDPFAAVNNGYEALCDGYGWRPLSTEWDFEATRRRIRREIFPEESRRVHGA